MRCRNWKSERRLESWLGESGEPDISAPRLGHRRKSLVNYDKFPPQQRNHQVRSYYDAHDSGTSSPPRPSHNETKRARSPVPSTDDLATSSAQFDSKRKMQPQAKWLACFNVELSQPIQNLHDLVKYKPLGNKENQASLDKCSADEHASLACDLSSHDNFFDTEGPESFQVVVGLCPDMCSESEWKERETKRDLDRTIEQEADLIRLMSVLQKMVDYLLNLLDQPYNDNFLSIYNFLWDRMRAIRMDLRMQYIFNQQAIIMLEQMQGFSVGFDAHLNIEQMSRTSVELFHMYNNQRKKGINDPTEKEFHGYYALLKLDKHLGYKVGPAKHSFDLAKMNPEIRCTPKNLFARDVARACRIGNYIAFFRLARKATYLQACLMHAHFAKIPNQKLAFEDCSIKYLTQSCKLLSWDLAVMEANVMADLQLATTEFAIWGGLSCLCIGYFYNGFPLSLERSSSIHMPPCPPLGVALEDGCASKTDAQSRKTDGDFRCSNFAGDYFLVKRDRSQQKEFQGVAGLADNANLESDTNKLPA
ncbi:hypothetical protein COCNU_01G017230 [Cocos nucifera]|uniref:SAC3/GANP/THP3 conserved domain-containing protein n=1 Tax=Cocos nucifera TaxID=13894 RepID=A0A8K0MVL2_COCNU|nr:hypothetical protein COCNU_01G017230 [Cocos nucifera]